jgi:hypothetical protein
MDTKPDSEPEGDFPTGPEAEDHHPEDSTHGNFAE